ncbi:MAG: LysM peptidoglycan-binding domain-containing protein [Flavobacterium sp.]|nr:LysM peptidoglycan-binding domain-containing protein [Flavobacterium sp.]
MNISTYIPLKQICLLVVFVLWTLFSSAQTPNYTKHTVSKGETITQIAVKYAVTPFDIYRLNPDSQTGIKENDVLLVPKITAAKPIIPAKTIHSSTTRIIQPKETWYSLSREVGVSVEQLLALNPSHPELKIGDTIQLAANILPKKQILPTLPVVPSQGKHVVQAKETKFGIAQKYGISVVELELQNPAIVNNLAEGVELIIPKSAVVKSMDLAISTSAVPKAVDKSVQQLSVNKAGQNKKLVLLLPFNAAKIQADTLTPLSNRLKKDAFLNLTLDFYTGALVAIDSAKTLGINIEVQVLDSEETKSSSALDALLKTNHFDDASAVIGPFYQQYVEKLSSKLGSKGIAVLSPLSKDAGKLNANVYQTMPTVELQKQTVLNYMLAQNGNVIVIADPKKVANKSWIVQNYPGVKFAKFTDKGALDPVYLKSILNKNGHNYVVLDTQKTNLILSSTAMLCSLLPNFTIQLAILEPNETLDYEEIPIKRLTDLKLLYPSVTRENNSAEAQHFRNHYKQINKVFPNQYAIRGFDLTFDTLLRLSQNGSFDSTTTIATQQVEYQFNYANTKDNAFVNSGVYLLELQADLSIKQLN